MTTGLLVRTLKEKAWRVATAESCTGGMVAAAITNVAGSSDVFECGYITYANSAKIRDLGIAETLIADHGAVSEAVARAMAEAARQKANVDVAVAITGVAGPGGGSAEKPIGLMHFACATAKGTTHLERQFGNLGRDVVRHAATAQALQLLLEACA